MAEVGERDGGAAGGGGGAGRAGGGCAGRGGAGAGRGRGGGRIGVIDYLEPAAGSEIGGDIEAGGGDGGGELAGGDGAGFHHDDIDHNFALGLIQVVEDLLGEGDLIGAALGDDGVLRVVGEEALDIGDGAHGVDDFL